MYPHKRRQRKRSCHRFRRCAGAVECMAEYRKITRASPPALWVSGNSRATPSVKGVAIRAHTERHTLPRRPVRTSDQICSAAPIWSPATQRPLQCLNRMVWRVVRGCHAQVSRSMRQEHRPGALRPNTVVRPVDGRPGLFRLPSVTARRHGECPADHRRYASIERLGVYILPPIAYRIRGECMAQLSQKNMLLLSSSTAAGNVPDGVTPGFLDFAEPWITALFAHAAHEK